MSLDSTPSRVLGCRQQSDDACIRYLPTLVSDAEALISSYSKRLGVFVLSHDCITRGIADASLIEGHPHHYLLYDGMSLPQITYKTTRVRLRSYGVRLH